MLQNARLNNKMDTLVALNEQQTIRPMMDVDDIQPRKLSRRKVYEFTETYQGPSVTYALGTGNGNAVSFDLNSLTNVSSYTALFDQYRIVYARVRFFPTNSLPAASITAGATPGYPPVYTVLDYDDASVGTITDLQQYNSLQIVPYGQFFERRLTPRALQGVYQGAVFTGYALLPSGSWIDAASTTVNYYGLKFAVNAATAPQLGWTTQITLHIQFQNSR